MENPSFEIVKASTADLDTLVHISRTTFYETFAKSNSEENIELYLNENVNSHKLTEELLHPHSEFYLAKTNGKVIGYLKVNFETAQTELHDPKSLEVERIYVAHEYLGKNMGKLLFAKARDIARNHNLKYIWLGVWEENQRAIAFYHKNGFVTFNKHAFMLGNDRQTDLLMKLELQ